MGLILDPRDAERAPEPTAAAPNGKGPMLQVISATHQFAGAPAAVLEDVSIEVAEGSFVTLIGRSGCGKTTLLRIVAGLLPASAGADIRVAGASSTGPSRDKAMVFQHFNLFPWRTALANVAYGLELQGVAKAERLERAREYLRLVGLEDAAGRYPGELSGGMQQRVGIARALAVEPKILLMDEPFGALDALTRETMQTELQKICEQTRATVLFVTHSIDEALYLSDRVLVMGTNPGRVVREFEVDLPRPRWRYRVRSEPAFARLRDELAQQFESGLAG
jgi:NitT/TauT family transport system ATP-binding protein